MGRYIFIRRRAATSTSAPIGPRIQPYRSTVSGISSRNQSSAEECSVGSASINAYLVDTLLTATQTGLLPTPPSLRAYISIHQPPDRGGAIHCRILPPMPRYGRRTSLTPGYGRPRTERNKLKNVCHHCCRLFKRGCYAESLRHTTL